MLNPHLRVSPAQRSVVKAGTEGADKDLRLNGEVVVLSSTAAEAASVRSSQ